MEKQIVRKILYGAVALFLLFFCVFGYEQINRKEKMQVDILFLGDSLIGQVRDETSVPYLVGEMLGMSTFNGALGGTCAARVGSVEGEGTRMDAVSFSSLSHALAYDDFGEAKASTIRQAEVAHFADVVKVLEHIDGEKLKYLILEYGTNDFFSGTPIRNPERPGDEYTYEGALRSGLERLREAYPELQIIMVSPTYHWYYSEEESCENMQFGGGTLKDYVDVLSETAEEYGVAYLDLYTDFYPIATMEDTLLYTSDAVHPNQAGREKIAGAIVDFISKK